MSLVRKTEGYPVEVGAAAAAVAETPAQHVPEDTAKGAAPAGRAVSSSSMQPSQKDRSIVRQVAWKVAGFAMANWVGSPDAWFDKCVEIRAKIEKDILEA